MKNIGTLYRVKELYWQILPTKDLLELIEEDNLNLFDGNLSSAIFSSRIYNQHFNCNSSYLSPEDLVVLLEVSGNFKKVLKTNGEVGWTSYTEKYQSCFEELA